MPADFFGCIPEAEYHAAYSRWSNSMLQTFRYRRRLAEARYMLRTAPPEKPTAGMERGTLTHQAILHPDQLSGNYAIYPASVLAKNGAASTGDAKAFREENERAGKIVMKSEEFADIKAMADSVRRVCGRWLSLPCKRAHTIHWTNQETGVPLKMLADWIIDSETMICFDLKTTRDASPKAFTRSVEKFGYWGQDAQYREGLTVATGKPCELYFVAVEAEYPFTCAIHALDEGSQNHAARARLKTLQDLQKCRESGVWAEPWEGNVSPLSLSTFFDSEN